MNRRSFLQSASALLGYGELAFLSGVKPVSAAQIQVDPGIVRFDSAIEPLVRLFEDTPRAKLLEEVGARIRKGLGYRESLAALLLAAIRNIQPRPAVGFKFHAVLVVHSAHLVAQASPQADRWLPLLWAVDHFKESQADDVREGDWTMGAVDAKSVPAKAQAIRAFTTAMDNWDEASADAAAAGLARHLTPEESFEIFARYAVRDFRSIGHKAIYVANAWRTLDTIGWQHSEPVLRSLAYAILAREGSDPLRGDNRVDRPSRRNQGLAGRLRADWRAGRIDSGATVEMLAILREGSDEEAADRAVDLIQRGIAPQTIWDAVMCGASEVLMRNPGIVPLHTVTTSNAIRYLYERSQSDETRRWLLLQSASFVPFLRGGARSGARVDELTAVEPSTPGDQAITEIFSAVSSDKPAAARKILGYLSRTGNAKALLHAANRLIFLKGNDSHDYKFSAAVLEDFNHLSPMWRERYLAASVFWLNGSGAPDNELVERARQALAG